MELTLRMKNELVDLKESCYVNGKLNRERVDYYRTRVRFYAEQGYNPSLHESILGIFHERLNKQDRERGLDGVLQANSRRSA